MSDNEIKDTLILGCKMLTVGFVMVIVLIFAFIAATAVIIKYRDDVRCLHKHGTLEMI